MGSPDEETLESFFVADNNKIAYKCITNILSSDLTQSRNFVYLYGMRGTGKSHLLKAVTRSSQKNGLASIYLNLGDWLDYNPVSFLAEVETFQVICLDNIDIIAGNSDWETELFSLYNRWISKGEGLFIVTSHNLPSEGGFLKNELVTRLQSGITLGIKELTYESMEDILIYREELRGGVLPRNLAKEIVHKLKDMPNCLDALQKIDTLALEAKKRINRRLVCEVLNGMQGEMVSST